MQQAPHHHTIPHYRIPYHTCFYIVGTTSHHTTLYHTCCHIAGSISQLCRMLSNVGSGLPCQLPTKTTLARFSNVSVKRVLDHSHFLIACLLSEQWFCLRRNERRIILSDPFLCCSKGLLWRQEQYSFAFHQMTNQLETWPGRSNDIGKVTSLWSVLKSQNCQRGVVIIG